MHGGCWTLIYPPVRLHGVGAGLGPDAAKAIEIFYCSLSLQLFHWGVRDGIIRVKSLLTAWNSLWRASPCHIRCLLLPGLSPFAPGRGWCWGPVAAAAGGTCRCEETGLPRGGSNARSCHPNPPWKKSRCLAWERAEKANLGSRDA